jgi:hypothetical protein
MAAQMLRVRYWGEGQWIVGLTVSTRWAACTCAREQHRRPGCCPGIRSTLPSNTWNTPRSIPRWGRPTRPWRAFSTVQRASQATRQLRSMPRCGRCRPATPRHRRPSMNISVGRTNGRCSTTGPIPLSRWRGRVIVSAPPSGIPSAVTGRSSRTTARSRGVRRPRRPTPCWLRVGPEHLRAFGLHGTPSSPSRPPASGGSASGGPLQALGPTGHRLSPCRGASG